jgi:4-alpha-glucanotransferase
MQLPVAQLHHLAGLYGLKTSYQDMNGVTVPALEETLLAVLKAMGAPVNSPRDIPSAIREKTQSYWQKPIEPVIIVRDNQPTSINLRLPVSVADSLITGQLELENTERRKLDWPPVKTSIIATQDAEGVKYVTAKLSLPEKIPSGYHHLNVEIRGKVSTALIISAPSQACSPTNNTEKIWGVFLPLYSLQTCDNWGAGSYSDLETLIKWINSLGGRMVGTLPLLASFLDSKFGPGPYLPASRFFWNEFYVDINRVPELRLCPEAQAMVQSDSFQAEISAFRNAPRVEYRPQMEIKRKILERLANCFFSRKSERYAEFARFVGSHPHTEDYARFRAAGELKGIFWEDWTPSMKEGRLESGDYSEQTLQYYLYSQWICHEQVLNLAREFKNSNSYLYLDFPVGVHPYSYDVWRYLKSFIQELNVGAPPDPVFTSGQNWSFPPAHPEKMREQGYDYLINSLRHQLECATILRIDHMMGFHRLYCVPKGMENSQGLYLTYPAEELYAILSLESCRHNAIIIGEDLGIVPPEVRPMMQKNGIFRMFIGQYELVTENRLGHIPAYSVAALNTHDMFPFASFWEEKDVTARRQLKLIKSEEIPAELDLRRRIKSVLIGVLQDRGLSIDISADTGSVLKAVLSLMASSPAFAFQINLEDLWLEMQPQNIPSTNRPENWSQKARYSFEEFSHSSHIRNILWEVDRLRKGGELGNEFR